MDNSNQKLNFLQRIVNEVGMTIAVVLFFNYQWDLNIHWSVVILSVSMVFLLLLIVDYNKKNVITYIAIFCVTVLGLIILYKLSKINILISMKKLFLWFYHYQFTNDKYMLSYAFVFLLMFATVVMILSYFINKKFISQCVICGGLIGSFIYLAINNIAVNKVSLALILIYILQVIVQLCNRFCNTKEKAGHHTINIYMLPICILIGTTAVSLPSKSQPIQWSMVKEFMATMSDKYDDMTYYFSQISGDSTNVFSLNFAGYSDDNDGTLGGKVKNNKNVILKVNPDVKMNGSTYLIGSVSDKYSSNKWEKSEIDYEYDEEPKIDFYEMIYGLYNNQVIPNKGELLLERKRMTIEYNKIKTKSVFYPLKTYLIDVPNHKMSFNSESPSLCSKKTIRKGTSYEIRFYEVNYESDSIQKYLRRISKLNKIQDTSQDIEAEKLNFNKDECSAYLLDSLNIDLYNMDFINKRFIEYLEKRPEFIEKNYLEVPDQIPDRVYELANEITKGYDNNYDKLKAIESYFSTFRYTLSPSKTKEGEEFIDYFLFEQKEGYCTYFATAMAIMARCVDIPTRYVEGVLVNYETKVGDDFPVSSDSSHAWVEAYIEGFGWVPFEPTPSMHEDRYAEWKEKSIISQPFYPGPTPMPTVDVGKQQGEQNLVISKENKQRSKFMLSLCFGILLMIVVLMVVLVSIINQKKKRIFNKSTREEKAKYLFQDIMEYLKMEGEEIHLGETLSVYLTRLDGRYNFDQNSIEEVFMIYSRIRYANAKISETELERIYRYQNQLKNHIKNKLGWIRWVKYRIASITK